MGKLTGILVTALIAFVTIAAANRIAQLRSWLATDVKPTTSQ